VARAPVQRLSARIPTLARAKAELFERSRARFAAVRTGPGPACGTWETLAELGRGGATAVAEDMTEVLRGSKSGQLGHPCQVQIGAAKQLARTLDPNAAQVGLEG